tara:strand:+ start:1613 stop:2071 length:459 start_codon:yes stop_codon:yes gene_type:complete
MSGQPGQLQNYSVDQVAGAFVLCMGAIASLLLVVWQSKCHCKCNLCYIFQCERRPPSEDEMKGLKDQMKERAEKQDQLDRKENEILDKEEEILDKVPEKEVPKNIEQLQFQEEITLDVEENIIPERHPVFEPQPEPEPEPEPEIEIIVEQTK